VSADLPLEERTRWLTKRVGARDSDAHNRTFTNWDVYFAIVWAGTLAFALGAKNPQWPIRTSAIALLSLLVPWYVWAGRPEMVSEGEDERRSARYIVGAVLLFVPPALMVGEIRLATFALVPHCFMLLRMRWARAAVTVITILPVVGWGLLWRPEPKDVFLNSVFALVTLAFSMAVGSWIIRIIEQNKERAALIVKLDASREEAARLSAAHGALAERERLSREIHDTLAQGFTSLLMLTQAVESEFDRDPEAARRHLRLMGRTARENLAEARALVTGGSPAYLDEGSLEEALRRLTARHVEQTGAPADVRLRGEPRRLPPAVEVVALRTCQEALTNVRRHAGASAPVTVHLEYGPGELSVRVRDQGCGFDTRAAVGYGLPGIRARAAEIGGAATVDSTPGRGTEVSVALPTGPPRKEMST
jgi:signal transduction histidine kinase